MNSNAPKVLIFSNNCLSKTNSNGKTLAKLLEKYPTGKLAECKKCCTMTVDNFNPDTFLPLLEEIDIPYVPNEWMALVTKYCKDATKITGMTVIGRYISKMRLKQWRDFRYNDSEYLQNLEITKNNVAYIKLYVNTLER